MDRLRERELQAVAAFAHDAAWVARFEPRRFERWIVESLRSLVPSDGVQVLVSRWPESFHLVTDDPRLSAVRNSSEGRVEWARLVAEHHPFVIERLRHPRATQPLRLSDFVTQPHLRRLELYADFLQPFEIRYCATARFFGWDRTYDFGSTRRTSDFTQHDLLLLDVAASVLGLAVRAPPQPAPRQLALLGITSREAEILHHVAEGRSNPEIAGDLNIAPGTVKKHLDNIFEKLGVRNRLEASRVWMAAHRAPSAHGRSAR